MDPDPPPVPSYDMSGRIHWNNALLDLTRFVPELESVVERDSYSRRPRAGLPRRPVPTTK